MRKLFLLVFLFFFLLPPVLKAQSSPGYFNDPMPTPRIEKGMMPNDFRTPPLPPKQDTLPNLLGQDHQYSVILRGNGEAVITGKMTFSNNTDRNLTALDLKGPSGNLIDGFVAYQQQRQGQCTNYRLEDKIYPESSQCGEFKSAYECDTAAVNHAVYNCSWYACVNKCLTTGSPTESVCPASVCDRYEEPDYFTLSYNTRNTYQKLKTNYRGNSVTLFLNKPVSPQSSGSIIFYYTQSGIARKNIFGAYDFQFETLKVDDKIRNITVGLSADTDYFLKDTKGLVEYRQQLSLPAIASKNTDFSTGVASPQMDTYYNQIGTGQTYKTAANLQANESYKIKGSYADAQWKLYALESVRNIFLFILAVIVLIVIIRLVVRNIIRGLSGITVASSKKTSAKSSAHPLILSVCLSFASSLIILVSIITLIFLNNNSSFYYSYSPYQAGNLLRPLFILIINLILVCIDISALFLPAVFMWKKAGTGWGILTFMLNIMWFFFYLLATFLVVFIFSFRSYSLNPPYPAMPPIAPMMKDF